jgi:hypothetical protein
VERDDDIWDRMLLWTSERTGVSRADIEKVVETTSEFWMRHAGLSEQFMSDEDD